MRDIFQQNIDLPMRLAGIGHYFPGSPVTSEMIEEEHGISKDWVIERTGIESRHWADNDRESFVDMAQKAAEIAIEEANIEKEDIDILICTSSTVRPIVNPSTNENQLMDIMPPLQKKLGVFNAFGYDLTAVACLGFVNSSLAASSLAHSLDKKNALVVCVESPKGILNFKFKNSTLFGAGAAAAVWKTCRKEDSDIIDITLHSDGRYYQDFDIDEENKIMMKGKSVASFATKALIEGAEEMLRRNNLTIEDIDWFIPHQANMNIIRDVQDALKVPDEKLLINIRRRGNTSSVGGPSCFSEYVHDGTIRAGELVYICSVGRGYSWGGILVKYNPPEKTEIEEGRE